MPDAMTGAVPGAVPDATPEVRSQRPPRVVVGVDGSEESKRALRWGASIAAATGASVDAVIAWHYQSGYGASYLPTDLNPTTEADKVLTETVDEVFGMQRPDDLHLAVVEGQPARVLLDACEGALMIVVGSRGHGGFMGLLLGSVSASLAEHAQCPVLVVHGENEPPVFAA